MINLGLKRTTRLLQQIAENLFHQPHFDPPWKAVHIAGTNGKGSVASYLSALLRRTIVSKDSSEIRIGRFTSPHFIDRWDCITINDEAVSRDVFETAEKQVIAIARKVAQDLEHETLQSPVSGEGLSQDQIRKDAMPTEFELLTATAFTIFSQPSPKPCDIAIIECGLGGRLDATNALPDLAIGVSVITRIGLDHVGILGGSLESIVREKCGIFRAGVGVVVDGENEKKVLNIVSQQKQQKQQKQHEATDGSQEDNSASGILVARPSDLHDLIEAALSEEAVLKAKDGNQVGSPQLLRLMPHQRSNLSIALNIWKLMYLDNMKSLHATMRPGLNFSENQVSPALVENVLKDASKSYPARLQLLQPGWLDHTKNHGLPGLNTTPLLLDGAHNEQSALVLRDFVDKQTVDPIQNLDIGIDKVTDSQTLKRRPVIWILALSSTKPPTEVLSALLAPKMQTDGTEVVLEDPNQYSTPKDERTKIIFTSFGPIDSMPWVKATPTTKLIHAAEALGQADNVHAATESIIGALDAAEDLLAEYEGKLESERPLLVVAGSLYLASDFLRFLRDGRDEFERYWKHALG